MDRYFIIRAHHKNIENQHLPQTGYLMADVFWFYVLWFYC